MRELFALAKPQDGVGWRDKMFASKKINGTEGHAVGNGDGTTVRTLRRSGLWSSGEEGPPSLDATAGNLRLQS